MASTPVAQYSAPDYSESGCELILDQDSTFFRLWSPEAEAVRLILYPDGENSEAVDTLDLEESSGGLWTIRVGGSLVGLFYTFSVKFRGAWMDETPGIWAKAVGINGRRAAIIDMKDTDPYGWASDRGPALTAMTDAIIYETHYRDFSMHPSGGYAYKGKYLALAETGTRTPSGEKTGIDHLKELGITHIHLLPSADFNTVDEAAPYPGGYNWGYDPVNYNVPEGSYATDPYDPAVRIKEMKTMIKALHDNGIGVVLDVVYNHTSGTDNSCFTLTAPGYFYRLKPDGSFSNASGCGNELASEREMTRKFIVESLVYWAGEYHIDGFRLDLMGVLDIDTVNAAAAALSAIRPGILLYGEGWSAGPSVYPARRRALKENVVKLHGVAVFSDDMRDAVKGDFAEPGARGFVSGQAGLEEAVKIAVVASTAHPQVDYTKGIKSKIAYASSPVQIVNYVSCHDNLCLTDKLAASMPEAPASYRMRAARLAQTIVFTSQGIPFMFAGEELYRSKQGVANSYNSTDDINSIDWELKNRNRKQFDYYRELIRLRKDHPALRLTTAREIGRRIRFDDHEPDSCLVSYTLDATGTGDRWHEMKIAFNGSDTPKTIDVMVGEWLVIADDGQLCATGLKDEKGGQRKTYGGEVVVKPVSALILALPFKD